MLFSSTINTYTELIQVDENLITTKTMQNIMSRLPIIENPVLAQTLPGVSHASRNSLQAIEESNVPC